MSKYYSLKNILTKKARYNVIFGERSNGKTYAVLEHGVKKYFENGETMGIIRRWDTDFQGANSSKTMFDSLTCNGNNVNVIEKLSKGKYNGVVYYSGRFYLTQYGENTDKSIRTDKIIAYAFALNVQEHYKGSSFPTITTILFDEFMTRRAYLVNEFIEFQNLLSTIIRQRDNVIIFMCANTVNKYGCPYFQEMGLYRYKQMKQGDIDVYTYGESGLTVAVEWSDSYKQKKPSDVYFAFNNPRLAMIKTGAWEMDIYPHLPYKYRPKDIAFIYFIVYEDKILQCEVITLTEVTFTYIHLKTTELKDPDRDLIFQVDPDARPNYRTNIRKQTDKIGKRIAWYFIHDKVFYQDNEVGEIVRNYLQWCGGIVK